MSYQKMYTLLFNAITDALQDLSAGAVQQAMVQLAAAQQQAEELYLSDTQSPAASTAFLIFLSA